LHQHGVLHQQVNDCLARDIVGCLEAEFSEALVLADELGRGIGEQVEAAFEVGTAQGGLEIFDNVELDVPLA
jgi:hypothetical protein